MTIQFPSKAKRSDHWSLGIAMGIMILWNVISWQFPFFWDTVLNSKIATWYLQTNFAQLFVPEKLDAGHPPFFSMYLAAVWKLFGRNLIASHLAMLPFLLLLLWQYWRLTLRFLDGNSRIWAMLILFCEPTFAAQSTMMSPDVALVAFFLLALNALLDRKRMIAAIAMILMAAMSFRGILLVAAIFLADLLIGYLQGIRRPQFKKIGIYLPVTALTLLWLGSHWQHIGWLFSPPPETYGGHREVLGIQGMLRNFGLIGWRMLDYGRVFLWIWVFVGSILLGKNLLVREEKFKRLVGFMLATAVLLTVLFVPFSNPIGHRYFWLTYIFLGLMAIRLAELAAWNWKAKAGIVVVLIGLMTGNFWVYPEKIAQGWDASLAHLPYFGLKQKMDVYLKENAIPYDQVCADFPLLADPYYTDLSFEASEKSFKNYIESASETCQWILVSNINNGFSDEDWQAFESEKWQLVQAYHSGQLYLKLFHSAP